LLKEELVSQSQYDRVEAQWTTAKAMVEASKAAVSEAEAAIATLQAKLSTQGSLIKEASASLSLAKLDLRRTIVVAPQAGRLGKKNVDAGKYLQAGQPFVSIVDENSLWVTANSTTDAH